MKQTILTLLCVLMAQGVAAQGPQRAGRREPFTTQTPMVHDPVMAREGDTYKCACEWEEKAKDLAARFIKNFKKYEGNEAGKALVAAGPKL